MNNLQKLIKLRGLTIRCLADEISQGYHTTQKVIKGATYKRSDGSLGVRKNIHVENGVARVLGLTHSEVWGKNANATLKRLIRKEISKQVKNQRQRLRAQYLGEQPRHESPFFSSDNTSL